MQIIYLADYRAITPNWALNLPLNCSLLYRDKDNSGNDPFDLADLAIISQGESQCIGRWLSMLHICRYDCPKIAIANLSATHQKTLLSAGFDAVIPGTMPDDVLVAQLLAFLRLQRKFRPIFEYGPVHFHNRQKRVTVREQDLRLTAREFDVLHFIANANGRPVDPAEMMRKIFGLNIDPGTNIAAVHVYRLRKKLAGMGFEHLLQTVQGRGYRLLPDG